MQNTILMFIHLMAAAVGLGSMIYCILLFLPALKKLQGHDTPVEDLPELKMMDILAPTVFVCLLVLIGTGVYYLQVNYTDQVNLKPGYNNIFGVKIFFVAVAFGFSVYQTFGLRSRISDLDLRPENKELVPETLKDMVRVTHYGLWVTVFAAFLGVWLARY